MVKTKNDVEVPEFKIEEELPVDISEELPTKEYNLPELPPDGELVQDHNVVIRSVFGQTQAEGQRWMQNIQRIGNLTSDAMNTIQRIREQMETIQPIAELLAPSSSLFPEQVAINERNNLLTIIGTLIVVESHLQGIRQERDTLDRELRRKVQL